MLKKAALLSGGAILAVALLFGGTVIPYAKSSLHNIRTSVKRAIPLDAQLDAARQQIEDIGPEIRDMVHKVASEKVAIKRLHEEIDGLVVQMESEQTKIVSLRDHLKTGDQHYVSKGRAFSNEQVRNDLSKRFERFKSTEKRVDAMKQVLSARETALDAALSKLDETKAQRRELEVLTEELEARLRVVEVQNQANHLNLDSSELSQARTMIDEIRAQVEAAEQEANMLPKYIGEIPVETDEDMHEDIEMQIDAYFDASSDVISS